MAQQRMINMSIWSDEHFGLLSDKAKLLFIACINHADDDGRLKAHPAFLRSMAFKYEDISLKAVENLLEEIKSNIINFKHYGVNGCNYIQLNKWREYQHIRKDRHQESRIPAWQPDDNQPTTIRQPKDGIDKIRLDKIRLNNSKNGCVSKETKDLIQKVHDSGFNFMAMLNTFYKRSKLTEELPEDVIQNVCKEILNRDKEPDKPWPYFTQVLKACSEQHFANKNVKEHEKVKAESIGDIFKQLTQV